MQSNHIKPEVNYREFRIHKLNTPEFSHVRLLLYWPIFGLLFLFLERLQPQRNYYPVYCGLDDIIPFCEWALIPYLFWFVFLIGTLVYTLIFLSFSVAGIPYAGLTAVLTAAFAFVPYIGGFLSCAFGILFTLLAAPNKALLCLIVYQATQFVENQFIYPHVVGNSVGLSPFWTLLAVLLGGKLFGVLGMIFFIPLMALVSQLLHESIERRLHTRKPELSNVQSNSDENTDISQ